MGNRSHGDALTDNGGSIAIVEPLDITAVASMPTLLYPHVDPTPLSTIKLHSEPQKRNASLADSPMELMGQKMADSLVLADPEFIVLEDDIHESRRSFFANIFDSIGLCLHSTMSTCLASQPDDVPAKRSATYNGMAAYEC